MAVRNKPRRSANEVLSDKVINRLGGKLILMLRRHNSRIASYIDESEEHKTTVGFAIAIDLSESEPSIEIRIRYSQSNTDKDVIPLEKSDDPNQILLIPRDDEENPMSKEEQEAVEEAVSESGDGQPPQSEKPPKARRRAKR